MDEETLKGYSETSSIFSGIVLVGIISTGIFFHSFCQKAVRLES